MQSEVVDDGCREMIVEGWPATFPIKDHRKLFSDSCWNVVKNWSAVMLKKVDLRLAIVVAESWFDNCHKKNSCWKLINDNSKKRPLAGSSWKKNGWQLQKNSQQRHDQRLTVVKKLYWKFVDENHQKMVVRSLLVMVVKKRSSKVCWQHLQKKKLIESWSIAVVQKF